MRVLSALGKYLGNVNDATTSGDTAQSRGRRWRVVDRLAGWLYKR